MVQVYKVLVKYLNVTTKAYYLVAKYPQLPVVNKASFQCQLQVQLQMLFTLTLGVLLFGMKAHWLKLLGVMVGLAGAASLILFSEEAEMGGNPWYGLLVIVGCICYAINSNTIAKYLRDMKALIISAASFSIVGVPAFLYIFQTDVVSKLESTPGAWEALGHVVLLSVMGTVIASIVFFQLIKRTTAVFASMISYLVPMVAVSWGFLDGESISIVYFIGMGLILSGVYLVKQ